MPGDIFLTTGSDLSLRLGIPACTGDPSSHWGHLCIASSLEPGSFSEQRCHNGTTDSAGDSDKSQLASKGGSPDGMGTVREEKQPGTRPAFLSERWPLETFTMENVTGCRRPSPSLRCYARPGQPLTQHVPSRKRAQSLGEQRFQCLGAVLGFPTFLQVCSRDK